MRIREYDTQNRLAKIKSPYRCTKNGQNTWFAKLRLKLNRDLASKGERWRFTQLVKWRCFVILTLSRTRVAEALRIAETATDRRRPSLFNDADIDRIREIKRWIDNACRSAK